MASSAIVGCNETESSSPSTIPKLGGSSAYDERTSIVMQSGNRAHMAIESKIPNDSTDPNLDQMITDLQPCTADIKQANPPDLSTHKYLVGTCPVDFRNDATAINPSQPSGSSTSDETYSVLDAGYKALNDVIAWNAHMDMTYATSTQGAQISATYAGHSSSQHYGTVTLSESITLNMTQNNYDENAQIIVDYEDGGRSTGIDLVHGHIDHAHQNILVPDTETCILNDQAVDCAALKAVFGGVTTNQKVVEHFSIQIQK